MSARMFEKKAYAAAWVMLSKMTEHTDEISRVYIHEIYR